MTIKDINDTHLYEQAAAYALAGQREQAYDLFRHISLRNPNDSNLTFWRMYTAPTTEKAEGLIRLARLNDPDNIILPEAEVWLDNRKHERPQPEGGFSRFPPRPIGTLANPFANNFKPEFFPRMALERGPDQAQAQVVMPVPTVMPVGVMPATSASTFTPSAQAFAFAPTPAPAPAYQCPRCGSVVPPITKRRVSKGGWAAFVILLILFFPLCWVGLVFQRESYQVCGHCNCELG
jgi:hypothetical protein